jgi:hypothetical protein
LERLAEPLEHSDLKPFCFFFQNFTPNALEVVEATGGPVRVCMIHQS